MIRQLNENVILKKTNIKFLRFIMEINPDTEIGEIDQAALLRMATRESNKDDKKEAYLEHLRMMTAEAIKASEIEQGTLDSLKKV